jgi:hypothetical protein
MNRKKAIITKDKSLTLGAKGKQVDDQYQKPGGVKKISNSVVSGRSTGSMSYDPQVNVSAGLLFLPSALSALSFLFAWVKLDPDLKLYMLLPLDITTLPRQILTSVQSRRATVSAWWEWG